MEVDDLVAFPQLWSWAGLELYGEASLFGDVVEASWVLQLKLLLLSSWLCRLNSLFVLQADVAASLVLQLRLLMLGWLCKLHSSLLVSSARCFHMLLVSFSLALSVLQVDVAASLEVHQQWKTSTREQFLHVLQVRTKTRKRTWRMHDMRYSCFQPLWYEILLLWMGCLQGYPREWEIQSDLRGCVGNTFSEMKKCW